MQHDDEINVCPEHKKQVPMIFTCKFPGAELWCPYCGHSTGFPFGYTKTVKIPGTDLLQELENWKEKTRRFLAGETNQWCYEATELDLEYDPDDE